MKIPKKMVSVQMTMNLHDILRTRARFNNRALSAEILYLVETALALKSETTRETIHLLYKMHNAESDPIGNEASGE